MPQKEGLKRESVITKLRVVFDRSNNSITGVSLNSKVLVGPNEDLLVVLTLHLRYSFKGSRVKKCTYR